MEKSRIIEGDEKTLVLFQALLNQQMPLDDIFVFLKIQNKEEFLNRNGLLGKTKNLKELKIAIGQQIQILSERDAYYNTFVDNIDLLLKNVDLILKTKEYSNVIVPSLYCSVIEKTPLSLGRALWFYKHGVFVFEDPLESCCKKRYGIDMHFSPLTGAGGTVAVCPVCKKLKFYKSKGGELHNIIKYREENPEKFERSELNVIDVVKMLEL